MMLKGKTILVTRSADSSSELRTTLESKGASVICFPAIEIAPPDSWDACDNAIWKLAEYDSVCFTSKNAVTKFVERIRYLRPQAVDTLATRNIFAIGEKTRTTLESSGFQVTATPKHASAAELAKMLRSHQIAGAKILIPKSDIAGNEFPEQLREMGAIVDDVIIYRTVMPEPQNLEQIRQLLMERKIDIATFYSPSSILNFSELVGPELLINTIIATIGQVTADAVAQLGLNAAIIAKEATTRGLIETIEEHLGNHDKR